ncbi:MAG: hypothetical protein JWN52_5297 [Actinomycetia bacterium]|nr:hypothetical protein [Actinomycetes bacterium]
MRHGVVGLVPPPGRRRSRRRPARPPGAPPWLAYRLGGRGSPPRLTGPQADQHRRRPAISRYDDAFVLVLDSLDEFGKVVPDSSQRLGGHGHDCAADPSRG